MLLRARSYPKQSWAKFVTADNKLNVNPDGLDLLDKLLRFNHHDRLTAAEALAHSYFSTCTPPFPPSTATREGTAAPAAFHVAVSRLALLQGPATHPVTRAE